MHFFFINFIPTKSVPPWAYHRHCNYRHNLLKPSTTAPCRSSRRTKMSLRCLRLSQKHSGWGRGGPEVSHCTMCILGSMFSFQPNKLRHILKFVSWYIIQHIFVPTCSVGRKTWFSRKPWLSNSKFGISGSFWPILSVPKIMFLVPENEKRNKF